jgi:branched-chain amino acid transport system substrate-binding protein
MNKIGRSLAGPLILGGLLFAPPGQAEMLVGYADAFSGPAGWGVQIKRSIDLAVDELNRSGGVLGEAIRVIWADDGCDAEQAVAAARKLVADGVVFAMGHGCSHAAIAASKIYSEAGVPYMAASATNPKLTDEGGASIYRLRGRDDQVAARIADDLANNWGDKPIAIIHDGQTYGRYLAETVRQQLHEHGIEEAAYEEVTPGQLEFSGLIESLQAVGVRVAFFAGYYNEAGLFIRQARERGATFSLIGGDALSEEDFWLLAGAAAEGTLVVDPPRPKDAEAEARYVAAYRRKYPGFPADPADLSPTNYVALKVWAEAVETAGSFDAEAVAKVLHSHKFDTMFGRLGFDEQGEVTGVEMWSWYIWKDGRMVEKAPSELPSTD